MSQVSHFLYYCVGYLFMKASGSLGGKSFCSVCFLKDICTVHYNYPPPPPPTPTHPLTPSSLILTFLLSSAFSSFCPVCFLKDFCTVRYYYPTSPASFPPPSPFHPQSTPPSFLLSCYLLLSPISPPPPPYLFRSSHRLQCRLNILGVRFLYFL